MNIKTLISSLYVRYNVYRGKYHLQSLLPEQHKQVFCTLMYHGIGNNPWAPLDIPEQSFFKEIEFYQAQGYKIISSRELEHPIKNGPKLILTFDDGNKNILPVLQELTRRKIPYTIAICPGVIDGSGIFWFEELMAIVKYLYASELQLSREMFNQCKIKYFQKEQQREDILEEFRSKTTGFSSQQLQNSTAVHENLCWNELKELVKTGLCTIASHTLYHDAVTVLDEQQLKQDITNCKSRIKQELGVNCVDFICPFGDYQEKYKKVILDSGYKRIYLANNKLNIVSDTQKIIDRIKGVGFGNFSLRYFEYLWLKHHRLF